MNWVSIDSGNGLIQLTPVRRQAITRTNFALLPIGPLGTNFSEIRIKIKNLVIYKNGFESVVCESQPFCFGRDDLIIIM